ncbi:MAG TPA: hypothetical protein PLZ37_18750 [Nitrospira sp.]|nr:hypothetical protein [Nitrospira sp. NTP1]HQR16603.1 hypothetical protein [Nitrospira sp.]
MHEVALPEELFIRLQKLAVPLVDKPADVIERLISHYEKTGSKISIIDEIVGASIASKPGSLVREAKIAGRIPRERGVTIEIDGHVIRAISVKEMYQETLKYLLDKGHSKRIKDLLPFSTSGVRYLIADRPVHPKGNDFREPIKCGGYFMEAHKGYKTAVKDLSRFIAKLGLKLKYLGV